MNDVTGQAGTASSVPLAAGAIMKVIEDQLTEERSCKTSLETRAIGVITTSGTLTTLLFALAALVTKSQTYALPVPARYVLFAAVIAFLAAAIIALWAAKPTTFREFTVDGLRSVANPVAMSAPAAEADHKIAEGLIQIIDTARRRNGEKASRLKQAVYAEVLGTILVGVAVGIILING